MGVSLLLEALGLLKSESCEAFRRTKGIKGRVRRYDIVVWAARCAGGACRTLAGRYPCCARGTAERTAAACPSCGVLSTSVKGRVIDLADATSPTDEKRIMHAVEQARWRCREDNCSAVVVH